MTGSSRVERGLPTLRHQFSTFFHGQSEIGTPPSTHNDVAPKLPMPRLGLQLLTDSRTDVQTPTTSGSPITRPPSSTRSIIDPSSSPGNAFSPLTPSTISSDSATLRSERLPSSPMMAGARLQSETPEDRQLFSILAHARNRGRSRKVDAPRKKRFALFSTKNKEARGQIISCLISGSALAIVLTIYLALSITNAAAGSEFHVLLILVVLVLVIIFAHSLVRLSMLVFRSPTIDDRATRVPSRIGPSGYAQPEQPIRVVMMRDEELGTVEDSAAEEPKAPVAPPPPAYGLWRSSVRVNPDLMYWQRVDRPEVPRIPSNRTEVLRGEGSAEVRPPSYISEDGVEYILEAQPRSTAPEHLPLHPSERGRIQASQISGS